MKLVIGLMTILIAGQASAKCSDAYRKEMVVWNQDDIGRAWDESASLIDGLLSNIPSDVDDWAQKQNYDLLLSTTGAPTTTTLAVPMAATSSPTTSSGALDSTSKYSELKGVQQVLAELEYSYGRGGLRTKQLHIRLKEIGYTAAYEKLEKDINQLNDQNILCKNQTGLIGISELKVMLLKMNGQ